MGISAPFAVAAERYRDTLAPGETVGRIEFATGSSQVPVTVGLDQSIIDRGPGWYPCSGLPGEGRMIYIAGHRTTHGAPFLRVGALRPGDEIRFIVPYAVATYNVTRLAKIEETHTAILRARPRDEQLRLQTSTIPAGHTRLLVFARRSSIERR
jgi:sortase A